MPPKGSKRASTVEGAGSAAKRVARDTTASKCKEVVKAIGNAESLPASCQEMMASMAKSSLTIMAADRHPYQVKAVEMIGETLAIVEKQISDTIAQAQAKVDGADAEKASRAAAVESAQASIEGLEKKSTEAKEAVEGAKTAFGAAKVAASGAKSGRDEKAAELATTRELKAKLEKALTEIYEPLKASKAMGQEGRRNLNALEKLLTEVGLEEGLVSSIHETFRKGVEERGTYDGLVVKHLDKGTAAYIAKAGKEITEAEASDPDLASSIASAEAAVGEAETKVKETSTALIQAEMAVQEGKDALTASNKAVANFDKEMANAGNTLEKAKTDLAAFREGPLKHFTDLKDLAPPPPEPAASPEESAAEDAPAQAAEDAPAQ